MNVNNTERLTSSDQICPVGEILVAWSVCLFCGISVHLGWLFVFVVVFVLPWLITRGCLPGIITITIIIIICLIKAVTRWLSPVIMSPYSVGESMRKLTGTILDNICRKIRGREQIHEKLKWPILFLSQNGTDLLKLRSLIATNWELLCFMIHFTDWRIALGDTFTLACRDLSPDTGSCSCVHGIVHPVYVSCKKLVMPLVDMEGWIWSGFVSAVICSEFKMTIKFIIFSLSYNLFCLRSSMFPTYFALCVLEWLLWVKC